MNVIIIEDEHLTAERIAMLLKQIDPEITVISTIDTVKKAVEWFSSNAQPDLVFMDIQLADGLSFDIFDIVKIEAPVVFITAYQEYAIKAFKVPRSFCSCSSGGETNAMNFFRTSSAFSAGPA